MFSSCAFHAGGSELKPSIRCQECSRQIARSRQQQNWGRRWNHWNAFTILPLITSLRCQRLLRRLFRLLRCGCGPQRSPLRQRTAATIAADGWWGKCVSCWEKVKNAGEKIIFLEHCKDQESRIQKLICNETRSLGCFCGASSRVPNQTLDEIAQAAGNPFFASSLRQGPDSGSNGMLLPTRPALPASAEHSDGNQFGRLRRNLR